MRAKKDPWMGLPVQGSRAGNDSARRYRHMNVSLQGTGKQTLFRTKLSANSLLDSPSPTLHARSGKDSGRVDE